MAHDAIAELVRSGIGACSPEAGSGGPGPGLELSDEAVRQLVELAFLLDRWSGAMNLTGHRGPEAIVRRLILDAIAFWREVRALQHPMDEISDLGSGAGFPGIPVAILEPGSRVVLVEAREKRIHFQRAAKRELGLPNLEPRHGRIEGLDPTPSDIVVAQALAPPPQALEWGLGWVKPGGVVVLPGAEHPPDPGPHPGIHKQGTARYRVPLGGPSRTLWWGLAEG